MSSQTVHDQEIVYMERENYWKNFLDNILDFDDTCNLATKQTKQKLIWLNILIFRFKFQDWHYGPWVACLSQLHDLF